VGTGFLQNIREEMERSYRLREAGQSAVPGVRGAFSALEQAGIESALAALHGSYALVGRLPPEPPTWRGRLGGRAVKLVKRMLFWYTPQIVRFQYSVVRAFEEQAKALELANQRIRALEQEVRALRGPGQPAP